jgi:transposase InsO family protein
MSARRRADIALLARIHAIHRKSKGCYGARPIHEELRDEHDIRVGCKRVARLMREAGLQGVTPKAFVCTTASMCVLTWWNGTSAPASRINSGLLT